MRIFILLILFSINAHSLTYKSDGTVIKGSAEGIEDYGRFEIPENANPNNKTLRYYLNNYLNDWDRFYRKWSNDDYKYLTEGSGTPYEFEYSLSENEDIKQQMQETALLSYILYEDGKIIIDEITPKDRFGDLFDNKSKLHSQSVGKSITSYILGHAICEGYINSLNSKLDDWSAVENTVYHNQNLIDLLNMNAGDHTYITQQGIINSKRYYNSYPVQDFLNKEFKGSKKKTPKFNYHGFMTNLLGTYVLYKTGDDFQQLLDFIFQEKAQIEDSVFFTKQEEATPKDKTFWNQFRATRYDYLRISRAMLEDWNNDTCVGKYLKDLYNSAVNKNNEIHPDGFRLNYTKKYAGQFHTHFINVKRPIMMMDGFGGQIFILDFEKNRIIAVQAIHDNFDFNKLVYDVLEPESTNEKGSCTPSRKLVYKKGTNHPEWIEVCE